MNIAEIRNKILSTRGLFLIILAITIYLRMINVVSEQLWHDEGGTIYYVNSTWEHMWENVTKEKNPILYYTILKLWISITGTSVFAYRLLSVIFSVLTLPIIYLIGRELTNKNLGLIISFLYAISPFSIWYANEVRMYSLLQLLFTIDLYFAIKILKEPSIFKNYILFSVVSVCMIYTHYAGMVYLTVLGSIIFIFNIKKLGFIKNAFYSIVIIIICYIPWIPYAYEDYIGGPTAYTGGELSLINLLYWAFYFFIAPVPSDIQNPYVFSLIIFSFLINIPIVFLSIIGFIGFLFLNKTQDSNNYKKFFNFIIITTILFFLIPIIVGILIPNTFQAKNLIGGTTLVQIIEGLGLYHVFYYKNSNYSKNYYKFLKYFHPIYIKKMFCPIIIAVLICNIVIFPIFKTTYLQKPDWEGCVKKLKKEYLSNDIVINQYGQKELPDVMKYYCEKYDFDFSDDTYDLNYEDEDKIKVFIDFIFKENISRVWIIGYWHDITDPDDKTENKLIDKYNFDEIEIYNFRLDLTLTLYEIP